MTLSRSFKVALSISVLIHAGVFAVLDREPVAGKIFAPPKPLLANKPRPKAVRFELIDTPASAEAREPPKKSTLMSDKNTRAQDKFQGKKKLEDSPHLEGKHADSKDTRPRTVVAKPSVAPEPEKPREKSVAEKQPVEQKNIPDKEAAKAAGEIRVAPSPEEQGIIRVVRKAQPEAVPAPPMSSPAQVSAPRLSTSVDADNPVGDALIEGEISFGATRHFFGEYLLHMKQAIETEWISHLVSQYTGIAMSTAVIDFKIQPDGTATNIVAHSNQGDPYFPLICISSIRDAQPFKEIPYDNIKRLPEEFKNKPLNIRFTFRYN